VTFGEQKIFIWFFDTTIHGFESEAHAFTSAVVGSQVNASKIIGFVVMFDLIFTVWSLSQSGSGFSSESDVRSVRENMNMDFTFLILSAHKDLVADKKKIHWSNLGHEVDLVGQFSDHI